MLEGVWPTRTFPCNTRMGMSDFLLVSWNIVVMVNQTKLERFWFPITMLPSFSKWAEYAFTKELILTWHNLNKHPPACTDWVTVTCMYKLMSFWLLARTGFLLLWSFLHMLHSWHIIHYGWFECFLHEIRHSFSTLSWFHNNVASILLFLHD